MVRQQKKKYNKGGGLVKYDPHDMKLIESDPLVVDMLQRTSFLGFFHKLQAHM